MTRTIAVYNMKGGVGKTTTCINVAAGLVQFHGQRVLIIDADPQGNSGLGLGLKIWEKQCTLTHVYLDGISMSKAIRPTESGVDVVPSNFELAERELEIAGMRAREFRLQRAIRDVVKDYDFILIDCPPNMGILSLNALIACDSALIPVDMGIFGVYGLNCVMRTLARVQADLEYKIKQCTIVPTRFRKDYTIHRRCLENIEKNYGEQISKIQIPESTRVRVSQLKYRSIYKEDPHGKCAAAYKNLVDEVRLWQTES